MKERNVNAKKHDNFSLNVNDILVLITSKVQLIIAALYSSVL